MNEWIGTERSDIPPFQMEERLLEEESDLGERSMNRVASAIKRVVKSSDNAWASSDQNDETMQNLFGKYEIFLNFQVDCSSIVLDWSLESPDIPVKGIILQYSPPVGKPFSGTILDPLVQLQIVITEKSV